MRHKVNGLVPVFSDSMKKAGYSKHPAFFPRCTAYQCRSIHCRAGITTISRAPD